MASDSESDSKIDTKSKVLPTGLPKTMASAPIGFIGPYNEADEEFEDYISRVKHYFNANDIDETKKISVLLTLIGPKGFSLATKLLSPKKLDDNSLTFKDIEEALVSHYKPKKIIIYERYKFHNRNQGANESIADFVAAIKSLASTCEFGDTLQDMLRDRFVVGLHNRATQQALLTDSDLDFKKATNVASTREAAMRELDASHSIGNTSDSVNKVSFSKNKGKPNSNKNFKPENENRNGNNSTKPKSKCFGCGQLHWKRDCPFANKECFKCRGKGHISKMCKNKSTNSNNTHKIENPSSSMNCLNDYDYVFNVNSAVRAPPIKMKVSLDGVLADMELDTGSYYSIMSNKTYQNLWPSEEDRPVLGHFEGPLSVYGGSPLTILGSIHVEAKLLDSNSLAKASIIIVEDEGPTLLGRGLLKMLEVSNIDLNVNMTNTPDVVSQFPDLFSPGLGCYKDGLREVQV